MKLWLLWKIVWLARKLHFGYLKATKADGSFVKIDFGNQVIIKGKDQTHA